MLTEDYRVKLETFEGPLDLLLFLIRKSEIDITDIPIAAVADQYASFLQGLVADGSTIDIEVAGDFLVMAATLMEIKSRWLARDPNAASAAEEGGAESVDPRAELVKQLLAYKQYKDAAAMLEHRGDRWQRRYPVGAAEAGGSEAEALSDELAVLEVEDLELGDLLEAFKRIVSTVNFERLGDHQIVYDDTPIERHAADIVERLRSIGGQTDRPSMLFRSLLDKRTRGEMIGLFLAVLDLVRRRVVRVEQADQAQDLALVLRDPDEVGVEGTAGESSA